MFPKKQLDSSFLPKRHKEPATVERLLAWGWKQLEAIGKEESHSSASYLLACALETDRAGLIRQNDHPVSEDAKAVFCDWIFQRKEGKPCAYLVGQREFFSLPFCVNEHVLIPRPETECLVEEALCVIAKLANPRPRICDVGTGSGALAVALAKHVPSARVMGTDFCWDALLVAKENAKRNHVKVDWFCADLAGAMLGCFDVVVANLPYVSSAEWVNLSKEVRGYEPRFALEAGESGLEIVERLVAQAANLAFTGWLLLEIGMGQEKQASDILSRHGFVVESVRQDFSSIPRVICARRGEKNGS